MLSLCIPRIPRTSLGVLGYSATLQHAVAVTASAPKPGRSAMAATPRTAGAPAAPPASLGFPRISQIFYICIMNFTKILQGNLSPRRSWEVLGGPRRSY